MPGTTSGPYTLGQVVRLSTTITVGGVATDATTVALVIKSPDGTLANINQAGLTKDSTGVWHYDLATTQAGVYRYRFVTSGTAQGAEEASFVTRVQEVI